MRLVGVPGVVYDNDMMMTDRVSAVDGTCWRDGLHRSSEVERVVTGFPVTRVAAVGPADHRVETVVRVGGVLDQPHGAVRVQHAVRSLDHVALPRFPLALHVVRFRIVHRVIELVSLWRLSTGFEKKKNGQFHRGQSPEGEGGGGYENLRKFTGLCLPTTFGACVTMVVLLPNHIAEDYVFSQSNTVEITE